MLEQPQAGLIGRFYRQVENRPKKEIYLDGGNFFQGLSNLTINSNTKLDMSGF